MSCVREQQVATRRARRASWQLAVFYLAWGCFVAWAQTPKPVTDDPEILSIFPLAGRQGQVWEAELRGEGLEGARGIWFDCEAISASVKRVESIESVPAKPAAFQEKKRAFRVLIEIQSTSQTLPGMHRMRLLGERGISNSLPFYIERDAVILEDVKASQSPLSAQPIVFPSVVSGKISEEGEVDCFTVKVGAGKSLLFELTSGIADFDPEITLYEMGGSWFDPGRLKRLAYNDDATPRGTSLARLSHQFQKAGTYVIGISGFVGLGKPDYCYRLRVAEGSGTSQAMADRLLAHADTVSWREREFSRPLERDQLKKLWTRGVGGAPSAKSGLTSAGSGAESAASNLKSGSGGVDQAAHPAARVEIPVMRESEPNDLPSAAAEIAIPVIIEGTIGSPGDVDYYRLPATEGQPVAFEIQTPCELPPRFSPHLEGLNANGERLFDNIYQRIGGDGDDWVQSLEAKCLFNFDRSGEYWVRIRDLTSRNGSSQFAYRLLIRPQVPHAGDITIREDRFNLVPGQAKKLTVTTGQEEGFEGQVAVAVENLPSGVTVLPASDVRPPEGPPFAKVYPERFVPRSNTLALLLYADKGTPATAGATWARVKIQPIVGGVPGEWTEVARLPVMVLKGAHGGATIGTAATLP